MSFEEKSEFQEKDMDAPEVRKKFWGRIAEIILGPEREYLYLHRVIVKINEYHKKLEIH